MYITDIDGIFLQALYRWLHPIEIVQILTNCNRSRIDSKPSHKPQSM